MKNVAAATRKMIGFYHGNRHDIAHFLKVWALAKTIGELEGLDGHTQEVLELAAVVHDIACPLCREKYGDTNGKHQELESPPLVEAFFADLPVSRADVDRISWLRTTIPIRTWTARTTGSCSRRISSSTRMRAPAPAPPSKLRANASSGPLPRSACSIRSTWHNRRSARPDPRAGTARFAVIFFKFWRGSGAFRLEKCVRRC